MTPEKQRIAIAEACGRRMFVIHKPIHDPFGYYREKGHGYTTLSEAWQVTEEVGKKYIGGRPTDHDRVFLEEAPLPNYADDLNAMHEAEKTLTDHTGYVMALKQVTGEYLAPFFIIHATASQRAEAFLKTVGKWEAA